MNILSIGNKPLSLGYSIIAMNDYIPVALPATYVSNTYFNLNWESVNYASSYVIDVATDIGFTNKIVNNLNVGNVLTYEVSGLTQLTDYYYRVRSIIYNVQSRSSNKILTTTTTYSNRVDYFIVGGGGGSAYLGAGGGSGGYILSGTTLKIENGNEYTIVIGAGSTNTIEQDYGYPSQSNSSAFGLLCGSNQSPFYFNGRGASGCGSSSTYSGQTGIDGVYEGFDGGIPYGGLGNVGGNSYCFGTWNPTYKQYNGYGGSGGNTLRKGNDAILTAYGAINYGVPNNWSSGSDQYYGNGGRGSGNFESGANGAQNYGHGSYGSGVYNGTLNSGYPLYYDYGTFIPRQGGSGIIMVKYITNDLPTMTGGTKSTNGIYTIHKFTTSGVFKKQ